MSSAGPKKVNVSDSGSKRTAEDKAKVALDERDEKSIVKLLKDSGVKSYEARVVSQLVERMRRYTTEILCDARDYADHAGRVDIAMDDVRLAVRKKQDSLSSGPPTRDDLIRLADEVNRIPLPPIPDSFGVRLPPPQYQTTLPNLQWDVEDDPLPALESEAEPMDVDGMPAQGSRNKKRVKIGAKMTAAAEPFTFGELNFSAKKAQEAQKAENKAKKRAKGNRSPIPQ